MKNGDPNPPLVSIIAICYNHSSFIIEAIESIFEQSYSNIEVILIDDASTDDSAEKIKQLQKKYSDIWVIMHNENCGITKSFNEGLKVSKGNYIIDFATDDILLPDRVSNGVQTFEKLDQSYGVNFTNALIINESGKKTGYHYPVNNKGKAKFPPPDGDVYAEILSKYFICAPSMMFRREVIENLHGYDEKLYYEDFDFWVRSSRKFKYVYTDSVLVKKRIHTSSLSNAQYNPEIDYARSTYEVCKKALDLNKNEVEKKALNERIMYELRQTLVIGDKELTEDYLELLEKNDVPGWNVRILKVVKELRNLFRRK